MLEKTDTFKKLKRNLENGQFSHAYLFEINGYNEGFDIVIEFAKQILCPKYNNKTCETCNQCKMIDENNFPELKIIDDHNDWIKKERLLDLQEEFSKKAIVGNKKVYIINHADRLNPASANSILKFLEEPEEDIVAILITDNRYQVLETIVSRCQIISITGQPNVKYKDENETVHRFGQVITNNKESYDSFCNDLENSQRIKNAIKFIMMFEKNGIDCLVYTNKYWHKMFPDRNSFSTGINIMLYFYKDILNIKLKKDIEIFTDYKMEITELEKQNSLNDLIKKIEIINDFRQTLDYNANLSLLMDKLIIEMEGGII